MIMVRSVCIMYSFCKCVCQEDCAACHKLLVIISLRTTVISCNCPKRPLEGRRESYSNSLLEGPLIFLIQIVAIYKMSDFIMFCQSLFKIGQYLNLCVTVLMLSHKKSNVLIC